MESFLAVTTYLCEHLARGVLTVIGEKGERGPVETALSQMYPMTRQQNACHVMLQGIRHQQSSPRRHWQSCIYK